MVDCDPVELGRNRPLAVGLASHIGLTLRALADALPRELAARVRALAAAVRKKEADAQARLMAERLSDDVPISHYRLGHEIAAVVDAETTVVGDGGDVVGCASKIVPLSRPGQWLDPGPVRLPGRRALVRDRGQAAAAGPARAADRGRRRLRAQRHGDGDRGALRPAHDGGDRQRRRLGPDPQPAALLLRRRAGGGTSLPFTRFERMVEALGGKGLHVTEPGQLRPALERALGSGEVYCINVVLDPAAYRRTGQVSMAI